MVSSSSTSTKKKTIIAYATSITAYDPKDSDKKLIDRAAVLHQSIRLAAQRSVKYDYHMYAFVHPDAVQCSPMLQNLGYRVQIRETPFNASAIPNEDLRIAQKNGCCGAKEYLKLYSYLLLDYPIVVHLDLDTIVLKSMDQVFDMMTENKPTTKQRQQFASESTMWFKNATTATALTTMPKRIDFMFTRDYNMVDPPSKQVHQMGVQGGFLLVRPNRRDFDDMVNLILSGGDGYTISNGWGQPKDDAVGGFYGAGTIQGLASYYYGRVENGTRSVELNRCYYNTMVDNPHSFNKHLNKTLCTTLEPDLSCEDCRQTTLEKVYTAHFTVCGKPEWCSVVDPDSKKSGRLCMELFREWHKVRLSLEIEWMKKFSNYVPDLVHVNASDSRDKYLRSFFHGHCRGGEYVPIRFPNLSGNVSALIE
ncbi:hypothetical protein IV203_000185 [Nitzschia inconspicua]|uniref:Uncharacterized protein n=1 Tax=Nitzschia inconspicua TaxID=303405 RepID=A0A9K3PS92_9STRA|nr:hypothetical protein IV203_000185 [Nitzschia inconspicua]